MRLSLALLTLFWSTAGLAHAQEVEGLETAMVLVGSDGADPGRVSAFTTHVERAARVAGYDVVREPIGWAEGRVAELGTLMAERVDAFRRVERLLVAARANTAGLMEDRALADLAAADQLAQSHADVPGAVAWIAEVQTAIGITAAQTGRPELTELSDAAFSRAATLDPSRGVRAAEAPPEVAERAAEILAAVARRPRGSFEVRSSAPNARVFLDDREIGTLPRIVRAPVGTHVLRVEAPGRSPWGQVVDVLEGRRPPMIVELAPDPLVAAARRLSAAVRNLDSQIAHELRGILGIESIWMLWVGNGQQDRALLIRCIDGGCELPRRLTLDEVPFVLSPPEPVDPYAFAADRRWLAERAVETPPPPPVPWWRRWYVWVGVGAVLLGAAAAIGVAAQPDPTQIYEVQIVPGDVLGPSSMP